MKNSVNSNVKMVTQKWKPVCYINFINMASTCYQWYVYTINKPLCSNLINPDVSTCMLSLNGSLFYNLAAWQ